MQHTLVATTSVVAGLLPELRRLPLPPPYSRRVVILGQPSIIGQDLPFAGLASAANAALESVAHTFRRELRPWAVEVSWLRLGQVRTEESRLVRDRETKMVRHYRRQPDEVHQTYGRALGRVEAWIEAKETSVVEAAARALFQRTPQLQYTVGYDAELHCLWQRSLAPALTDQVVGSLFGLQKPKPAPSSSSFDDEIDESSLADGSCPSDLRHHHRQKKISLLGRLRDFLPTGGGGASGLGLAGLSSFSSSAAPPQLLKGVEHLKGRRGSFPGMSSAALFPSIVGSKSSSQAQIVKKQE